MQHYKEIFVNGRWERVELDETALEEHAAFFDQIAGEQEAKLRSLLGAA